MATTKLKVFPEGLARSTGMGPDFPDSAGGREQGKFRPSATPRLTTVAVTGDDGESVALTTNQILLEILEYQKAILTALAFLSESQPFTEDDALREVS